MTEIEQQMMATLERVETEHSENMAAWRQAFETMQTEYRTIRNENAALSKRIEQLAELVNSLSNELEPLSKRSAKPRRR